MMIRIPENLTQKAGILMPVEMTERAYDKLMGDTKKYLMFTDEGSEIFQVLSDFMIAFKRRERSSWGGFDSRFEWAVVDLNYRIEERPVSDEVIEYVLEIDLDTES